MKLQSSGSGRRPVNDVESRANVARNCSGKSEVGGGLNLFVVVGSMGGSFVSSSLVKGSGAKGVRVSEAGMRGKAAVEKTKRSSGWEVGGGA